MNRKNYATATEALATFQALPDGAEWQELARTSRDAIQSEIAEIAEAIFPSTIPNVSADALAMLEFQRARMPSGVAAVTAAAAVHQQALATSPDVAVMLRTAQLVDEIGATAAAHAVPAHDTEPYATAIARESGRSGRAYQEAIARQLIDVDHQLADKARAFFQAAELEQRLEQEIAKRTEQDLAAQALEHKRQIEAAAAAAAAHDKAVAEARRTSEDARALLAETSRSLAMARCQRVAHMLRVSGLQRLPVGVRVLDPAAVLGHLERNALSLRELDEIEPAVGQAIAALSEVAQ